MANNFEVNQVIEGEVKGVQSYGAFVALNEDVQGLVHISEVTHGFVQDINDHLAVGDKVKVKILKIDEANNKYSLSIRATMDKPKQENKPKKQAFTKSNSDSAAGFNTMKDELQAWLNKNK